MPDYIKISELPTASSVAGTDQVELNQSGTSRSATLAQVIATPGSISLYNETVVSTAIGTIDVTIPASAKYIELQWLTSNTAATSGSFSINANVSGVPNTSAIYTTVGLTASGTTAAAFTSGSATSINLAGAASQLSGIMKLMNLGTTWYFNTSHYDFGAAHRHITTSGVFALSGVTGFRILNSAGSPTFITGSYLRCFATT